jgi:hypothetical protein
VVLVESTMVSIYALRDLVTGKMVREPCSRAGGITAASVTQLVTGKFRVTAGGPMREAKPRVILTDGQVVEIRRLTGDGVPASAIARQLGADPSRVRDFIRSQRRRLATE